MSIVPQPFPPVHVHPDPAPKPVPTLGFAGRRWPFRLYPGDLAHLATMRQDLHRDLAQLVGPHSDTATDIVLCASEMFANGVEHSRSGEADGHVIRTLTMPTATTLRLGVIDDGHRTTPAPGTFPTEVAIPTGRTLTEWEGAERGRGLLLVEHLSQCWGSRKVVDFPFCEGLGTFLWAEFALPTTPATPHAQATAEADR